MIIVYFLAESPKHFAALRKSIGISQKVLTQQLNELINDGIVNRDELGPIPARVVYSLTDYGRSVLPLVEEVRVWRVRMDPDPVACRQDGGHFPCLLYPEIDLR